MTGPVQGGVKFYRGSPAAARSYVEADHARADDYYLAEGIGLAERYVAGPGGVVRAGDLDGPAYERWVAGYDVETGGARGRLRDDKHALRFVEVVVNGPKSWSLAAALHPEVSAAYDAAMDRAAGEVIGWVAAHATTRVGPRGRQVQVPVEQLEAAVVRHRTSRAGDPHRHLHVQFNARVLAHGGWRGLHSVGVVDSIEALNGIGHAAVMCDPQFRAALAARGYTVLEDGEVTQLTPFIGAFSDRAAQIARNIDSYEATWRAEHPGQEPGPRLRRSWDRRAWADARPDKVIPRTGADLETAWTTGLYELGFTHPMVPPAQPALANKMGLQIARVNRDAAADLVLMQLGAKRSNWNDADIRGTAERLAASIDVIAEPGVRRELVEDIAARAHAQCVSLLDRDDVPAHVRNLTSQRVLGVERDLVDRITARAAQPVHPAARLRMAPELDPGHDPGQRGVVAALAGEAGLVVIEGAAGTGKTTTLAAARTVLESANRRLVVVTPTNKAAQAARTQVGTDAFSAAWLIHQYGYRWDKDGHWSQVPADPVRLARLLPGDVLLVDEAGMLDQDIALALFEIADLAGAGVALLGDRHQLPAVGRGGVLHLAARHVTPQAHHELETVHRFSDPEYAELSLLMRSGERSGEVFNRLLERGEVVVHASDVERTAALATIGAQGPGGTRTDNGAPEAKSARRADEGGQLVITDTRDQVSALNAAIRDRRHIDHRHSGNAAEMEGGRDGIEVGGRVGGHPGPAGGHTAASSPGAPAMADGEPVTRRGERIGVGDRVATRLNDRDIEVANRDLWTVTATRPDGSLDVVGRAGRRTLPADYVQDHVELAYATTAHGAQGETVDTAHLALNETTGAASAYVGMTRGRHHNTAHLVAESIDEARTRWVEIFDRTRADLGPTHAADQAAENIERYGPSHEPSDRHSDALALTRMAASMTRGLAQEQEHPSPPTGTRTPPRGIGR